MPDTSEPRAMLPFPSADDAVEAAPHDPLAGDWAEGLRGPVREVPLKRPTRLRAESVPTPRPQTALSTEQRTEQADLRILAAMSEAMSAQPPADTEVEAPDAWSSTDDELASVPPPARAPAQVAPPAAAAPAAGGEPAGDEVVLLSDAELAEDEPAAAPAPATGVEAAASAAPVAEPAAAPVDPAAPMASVESATAEHALAAEHASASLPAAPEVAALGAASEPAPVLLGEDAPGPVAGEQAGELQPLPKPALDAPMPAEGIRAEFAAPSVSANAGWARPETLPHATSETALDLRPPHRDAGPDATVYEGAPIVLPSEVPPAPAKPPLVDDDLQNTVLSLAPTSTQQPLAPQEAAPSPAAAVEEAAEEVEPLPEDAIAEALPEDAIAGAADLAAPWNHAEVEVTQHGAAPAAHTPWDNHTTPVWSADAASGGWAGSSPPAAPASEGWPGAAAHPAPSNGWGAQAVQPDTAHDGGWGTAAVAAPAAHDTWGASVHAAAPAASPWSAEPESSFSADKLVSSPGAADWVIEAAPPPSAAWETPKQAARWDAPTAPVAASAGEWDVRTQAAFPVAATAPGGHFSSPFAPLAPGASLSADEPALPDHEGEQSLDDADLPVPVYELEPVLSSSHLAVAGEHRVAVHTRAGRTRRGVVKDVDLAGTGFALQPQAGAGVPESVQAAEVKAIFFMLPPGEKSAPATGPKVRVTFEDGRTIEGLRDGADAPEGFFLVPSDAARTNTRRIFVARGAVQDLRDLGSVS